MMGDRSGTRRAAAFARRRLAVASVALVVAASRAAARESDDPIRLAWTEGDVAGLTTILDADGRAPIGRVEYWQRRRGDVLTIRRTARFQDGSSDEDHAEAKVGKTLETLRGRTIIRDAEGKPIVDVEIDVAGDRIRGFYLDDGRRESVDEAADLTPGTYFGPLIFLVLKNFDANVGDGSVVFRTVAVTPKPRVIGMELSPAGRTSVARAGGKLAVQRYQLRPTVHWLVDPLIRELAPETYFEVLSGRPPAMVRYLGPRNYAGQEIRIE
jgi:hypothetical protein